MSYAAQGRRGTVDSRGDTPRILMSGLVDDAGLFPPEQLAMGPALERYRRNRAEADPVLSHRFVCPASRLAELDDHLGSGDRIALSLILDRSEPIVSLDPRLAIAGFEVPRPAPPGWERAVGRPVPVFVEVAADNPDLERMAPVGWSPKIRCGGMTADLFPSPAQLAGFLREVVRHDLPFKATAGLHHAVSYRDPVTGFRHFGFLNLLLALYRAQNDDSPQNVAAVLEDEDEAAVAEQAGALGQVAAKAVRSLFVSYGSCSTSEPIEDLRRLGLHPDTPEEGT